MHPSVGTAKWLQPFIFSPRLGPRTLVGRQLHPKTPWKCLLGTLALDLPSMMTICYINFLQKVCQSHAREGNMKAKIVSVLVTHFCPSKFTSEKPFPMRFCTLSNHYVSTEVLYGNRAAAQCPHGPPKNSDLADLAV